MDNVLERRKKEKDFWRLDEHEARGVESLKNLFNKIQQSQVFLRALSHAGVESVLIQDNLSVLEIGGGQGWASCVLKKNHPQLNIRSTDLSEDAVASQHLWERVFGVELQEGLACSSDSLPMDEESIDIIFAFAAAHHFVTHKETLRECSRVLKPGGQLIYFYEPVTPKFWYRLAKWRVNRKRPDVPEDLLILSDIERGCEESGLTLSVHYFPDPYGRGFVEKLYYSLQSFIPILCFCLPSTATLVMTKLR